MVIADNGPGFNPDVIDTIGEPYVTTRTHGRKDRKSGGKVSGLGLGFFIAKTLLERSGARLLFDNREPPLHGAVVRVIWPRSAFEAATAQREQQIPRPAKHREPPGPNDPISDAI